MIIVTGRILARPERADELMALSLEHVRRSRTEAGCLSHGVHRDAENPARLLFLEEWADRVSLLAHFALPASRAFVKAAAACAIGRPELKVFDATRLEL